MKRGIAPGLVAVALVLSAVALSACGSIPAASTKAGGPSSSTTTTTPATTTTTTLPRPISIDGTALSGPLAFLGPVYRVNVVTPELGGIALPPAPTGLGQQLPSIRIAYRHFGTGPNLLLVMGEHGTMSWWDPQFLAGLAAHFTVTIFDMPGVGYSAAGAVPPTLDEEADITAGLILAVGLELPTVTVLGWGSGGVVALDALERHPGVAAGIVLLDSLAPGRLEVPPSASVSQALASRLGTLTGLSRLMFPPAGNVAREAWLGRVEEEPPDAETAAAVGQQAAVASSITKASAVASGLSHLAVPVSIISGDLDAIAPLANATALHEALPKSHLLVLKGAGYASMASDGARIAASVAAFAPPPPSS